MKFLLIATWMAMALVAVALPTVSDDFDLANVTDAVAWTGNSVEDPTVHTLEKRHTVTCDTGFHTNGFQVYLGIKELRKRRGSPFGGPYACTRVYNKRGTRIYWCNDDSKVRYLPS
ncbi:hypothetical protein ASPCAL04698 [Aspergillus calidoustus]|uniref:Uncharacterized protein n=1 Tax=Aspergillus calidoustus TaxID=454130 RepID=A0A0U5FZB6_ASPCI|nr:hypothetical protein ASPCAL04698 [Aspergillus calidoustus]